MMLTLLEYVCGGLAILLLIPVAVLFTQVLVALPAYRPRHIKVGKRPRVAILVPAHDETAIIANTLNSILPQMVAGDRLVVVADNCSDNTAEIAMQAGAEVVQRFDQSHRGKSYALDFGVRHLEASPPDIVMVIDADCQLGAGAIERLALTCHETAHPVQALYLMQAPANAGLKTRLAEFAWAVKNRVRALGFHRLGLPCPLMGSGMAFPWGIISQAQLASGQIVEDLKLGIDFACAGFAPVFCPEALVTSFFPVSSEGIKTQRTRWEHGHLAMIVAESPRLFWKALTSGDLRLLAVALDLCVPPLALLSLAVFATYLLSVLGLIAFGWIIPFYIALLALVLLFASVLLAWIFYGRNILTLTDLAYAPIYALWKIPLYLKFMVKRQVEWVRSSRDQQ
jgi:cellulose synthase/poly-beta-1,6-N-acetylglucosamine synthase-like glycosyltransferase